MNKIFRNPRTSWRKYGTDMLVITNDDKMVHKLNETGSSIWELTGPDGILVSDMIDRLTVLFDGDSIKISQEVSVFLGELCGKGVFVQQEALSV